SFQRDSRQSRCYRASDQSDAYNGPMHWRTIDLIWRSELSDLFRDRRTVFMIFMLPVVLYPIVGLVGITVALGSIEHRIAVGLDGPGHVCRDSPVAAAAGLSLTPPPGEPGSRPAQASGAVALYRMSQASFDYPPLVIDGRIPALYTGGLQNPESLRIVPLPA